MYLHVHTNVFRVSQFHNNEKKMQLKQLFLHFNVTILLNF